MALAAHLSREGVGGPGRQRGPEPARPLRVLRDALLRAVQLWAVPPPSQRELLGGFLGQLSFNLCLPVFCFYSQRNAIHF